MITTGARGAYDVFLQHSGRTSNEQMGLMLAEDQGRLLYQPGLLPEQAPTQRTDTFSYEHRSPLIDLPASFETFEYGAGFLDIPDAPEITTLGFRGYHYTQGVNLSHGKRGYLADEKQTGGSTTQAPVKFVDTSLGLFAMTARYVFEWTGAAWTQRLDTGGTITNHDLTEFRTKVGSFLLLGVSDQGYFLSTNGTVWRQISTTDSKPSHRSSSSANSTGATSLTPTEPLGAAENDIFVAVAVINADEAITPPAGWSEVTQQALTGVTARAAIFWIRRGGSAPALDFTWTSSVRAFVGVSAYENVYPSGSPFLPYTSTNFNINASGTSHSTGTATITWTKQAALTVFAGSDGASTGPGNWTAAAGYAENLNVSTAPGAHTAIDQTTTEGALSAATATSANACVSLGALLVLRPEMTGAIDVARWAARGSSSGESILWAIDTYGDIRNCTDPTNRSSWSAADSVQLGPQQVDISGLEVINNVFYLVHDGGITSYDGTTVKTVWDVKTLKLASDNARPAIGPDNRLYFAFGGTLLRLDTETLVVEKVWPRGPQRGSPELNGTITAITFDEGLGYFGLKNAAGNYYVMSFDPSYVLTLDGDAIWPVHTYHYNGSSAIGALLVAGASSDTFSTTNPQLVMGDGTTADYLILPKPGLLPEDDSAMRFETTADRPIYFPFIPFRAQAFPKALTRGDVHGDDLDANDTITLQYQEPGGSATTITTANSDGRTSAALSTPVSVTKVRPVALLNNGANTTTPILEGVVLHAAPNPPRDRGWQIAVRVARSIPQRGGGAPLQYDPGDLEDFLMESEGQIAQFTDLYGTKRYVKVLEVQSLSAAFNEALEAEQVIQLTMAAL